MSRTCPARKAIICGTCPHRMLPNGSQKETLCKVLTNKTHSVRKSVIHVFVHLMHHPCTTLYHSCMSL